MGYGTDNSLDFLGNPTDGDGGIYKSTDGGASWSTIDNGIPLDPGPPVRTLFGSVRDISLDLSSSIGGGPVQTLYVAGSGQFADDGAGGVTLRSPLAASYATIEVISVVGNCSTLEDVQSLTENTIPDDAHRSFDYGVLRFDIVDCTQATVEITFHGASNFTNPDWGMRIYAPTVSGSTEFAWQDFSASVSANKWTLNLTDGQFGDIRPTNGRILFQGGPGNFKNTLFNDGFE